MAYCDYLKKLGAKVTSVTPTDAACHLNVKNICQTANSVFDHTFEERPDDYMKATLPYLWFMQCMMAGDVRGLLGKKARFYDLANPKAKPAATDQIVRYVYIQKPYSILVLLVPDKSRVTTFVIFRGALTQQDFARSLLWMKQRRASDPSLIHNLNQYSVGTTKHDPVGIHKGVYETYAEMYDELSKTLEPMIATALRRYPNRRQQLIVTGLSLGGVLSTLAAVHLAMKNPDVPVNLFTFGSQRVGNVAFYKAITGTPALLRHFIRVHNKSDILAHIPPKLMRFYHIDEYLQRAQQTVPNHHGIDLQHLLPKDVQDEMYKTGKLSERSSFWHTAYAFMSDQGVVVLQAPCLSSKIKLWPFRR